MTITDNHEGSEMTHQHLESIAFTVQEVADLLSIDTQIVYRLIRGGDLKARRIGERSYRILKEDFDLFIERATVPPESKEQE